MSLSSRSRLPLVLPALALVLATACGAAAPPTASPAPPTPRPAPVRTPHEVDVPASVQGMWQAMIQGADVSSGLWTLKITDKNIYATNPQPGSESFGLGLTNMTADHATFITEQECQAGDIIDGTYTYAVVADQLTFTLIQDNCRDRSALLTAEPWDRKP